MVLILDGLKYNKRMTAKYIKSKANDLADSLSRNQMKRFRQLGSQMLLLPDAFPDMLWPLNKIWIQPDIKKSGKQRII